MRSRQRGTVARWGRLAVLLVLASGFLTMHGFLAVSATADVHVMQQHQPHHPAGQPHLPSGQPDHHDLVAGCVVAVVGVGLVGLLLLSQRPTSTSHDREDLVSTASYAVGAATSRWSPPRVALCVLRV